MRTFEEIISEYKKNNIKVRELGEKKHELSDKTLFNFQEIAKIVESEKELRCSGCGSTYTKKALSEMTGVFMIGGPKKYLFACPVCKNDLVTKDAVVEMGKINNAFDKLIEKENELEKELIHLLKGYRRKIISIGRSIEGDTPIPKGRGAREIHVDNLGDKTRVILEIDFRNPLKFNDNFSTITIRENKKEVLRHFKNKISRDLPFVMELGSVSISILDDSSYRVYVEMLA